MAHCLLSRSDANFFKRRMQGYIGQGLLVANLAHSLQGLIELGAVIRHPFRLEKRHTKPPFPAHRESAHFLPNSVADYK